MGAVIALAAIVTAPLPPGWSTSVLGLGIATTATGTWLQLRALRRALATTSGAQRAAFERARATLAGIESMRAELAARPAETAAPPPGSSAARSAEIAALPDVEATSRLLLIGGAPVRRSGRSIDHVPFGTGALPATPQRAHSHVLLAGDDIASADDDDVRWLARALRWQDRAVIAAPAESESLLLSVLERSVTTRLDVEEHHGLLLLRLAEPPAASLGSS